jgi:hypothetical protein
MQNKANLCNNKMNTTFFLTKDYENETALKLQKNKPIQSQFQDPIPKGAGRKVYREALCGAG